MNKDKEKIIEYAKIAIERTLRGSGNCVELESSPCQEFESMHNYEDELRAIAPDGFFDKYQIHIRHTNGHYYLTVFQKGQDRNKDFTYDHWVWSNPLWHN